MHSYLAVPPGQLDAAIAQLNDQIKTLRNAPEGQRLVVPLGPAVHGEFLAWLQRGEALPEAPGEAIPPQARCVMLRSCAKTLAGLPEAERQPFYGLALRSIQLLQQQDRSHLLLAQAEAIAALPEAARQPQWQNTLQAVEQLPPGERVPPFEPLAAQIAQLPMEARQAAFDGLLQAHRSLPAEHDQVPSLAALGTACVALPRADWSGARQQPGDGR